MSNGGERLNRERVLRAAVALADAEGIEALSMRSLAHSLGVVPMALYKHVANKEELLDGMVDEILQGLEPPTYGPDWKRAVRARILATRAALLSHAWAPEVIESRTMATPVVLDYMNSLMGLFRAGGVSVDLTHHAMHALSIRMWGFTREVFPTPPPPGGLEGQDADPGPPDAALAALVERYPYLIEMATASAARVRAGGVGCDAQLEFEFALDVLLDGVERLHHQHWTP